MRHGRRKDFLKLHFVVDRRSLLILSFKVTPPFKADSKQVEELLKFIGRLGRLCADKAYLSRKICDLIARHGGMPYISIKKIRAKGSKADAGDAPTEQEALQALPQEEPGGDRGVDGEEEGAEERARAEGPLHHSKAAGEVRPAGPTSHRGAVASGPDGVLRRSGSQGEGRRRRTGAGRNHPRQKLSANPRWR